MNSIQNFFTSCAEFTKRRRTIGPITPAKDAEHAFLAPASEPRDRKAEATLRSHFHSLQISGLPNPRKRAREDDEFTESHSGIDPGDSISQNTPVGTEIQYSEMTSGPEDEDGGDDGGDDDTELADEDEVDSDDEEEEEISPEDKVAEYLERQAELELRRKDIEAFKASGKHKDEIFLFERISMRGFEEILPATWQIDFPTLPMVLFTEAPERAFIDTHCLSSSAAIKALQSLLTLGVRVRDNITVDAPTERLMAREIRSYIKWSEKDGGYYNMRFLPVLTVVAAQPGQSIDSISMDLNNQMKFLAKRHRHHLAILPAGRINELGEIEMYARKPPLLYGIIVAQTMVIFFTLDSANPDATVRHLTHSQFADKKMDVWNEFAIAFTVIMARNYTMSIKDELEPDDPDSDPDPDA